MKLNHIIFGCSLLVTSLISCNNETKSTLKIGNGKDYTLKIDILDSKDIEKIEITVDDYTARVSNAEVKRYEQIIFGAKGGGENTIDLKVYTVSDTLHQEHYVEDGYRVHVTCTSSKIKDITPNIGLY